MKLKASYIVGFSDGEGTFNVIRYPDKRLRPQFLLFNTNLKILEAVKRTLCLKAPIFEVSRVKDLIKRRKTCYRLQVRSEDDIRKVVSFFDKNPPIIKHEDYKKFKFAFKKWLYIP